jgi:hypothetical protein
MVAAGFLGHAATLMDGASFTSNKGCPSIELMLLARWNSLALFKGMLSELIIHKRN